MTKILIYYRPDSFVSKWIGDLSKPEDIPSVVDVQAVVYENPEVGFVNEVSPEGYWIYRDGIWHGCDQMGFWGYIHKPGFLHILTGSTMTRADWQAVSKRVQDENFLTKSAHFKTEIPNRG